MKQLWLTILMIYVWENGLAQLAPQKVLTAPRIDETIRIDAVLDEAIWQNASPVGSSFNQAGQQGQLHLLVADQSRGLAVCLDPLGITFDLGKQSHVLF